MNRQSAEERYRDDAQFRVLVDLMTKMYLDLEFTPSEMRESAVFAAIRADQITIRASLLSGRPGSGP